MARTDFGKRKVHGTIRKYIGGARRSLKVPGQLRHKSLLDYVSLNKPAMGGSVKQPSVMGRLSKAMSMLGTGRSQSFAPGRIGMARRGPVRGGCLNQM
jgi:hypothetical protein